MEEPDGFRVGHRSTSTPASLSSTSKSWRDSAFPERNDGAVAWSACAGSSMDRASDYGSEGWGFDSLPARSIYVWFRLTRDFLAPADGLRGFA